MKKLENQIKRMSALMGSAFFIISIFMLLPQTLSDKKMIRAKSLKQRIVMEGDTERTDYVDENGRITFAADLGYATIITKKNENIAIEHFYDEKGDPIRRYSGYYGIIREYDENGRNYHVTYLGIDDLPVMTGYGYSDKYYTFYDNGKTKTEKYYDPIGNPVCSSAYGYGLIKEYDDNGDVISITYLNDEDQPMRGGLGYAIVKRNPYQTDGTEKGKAKSEFYFDEEGKPTALSLGQYGVYKEYDENGQECVLTYLDQDGNPIVTNKGYATVKKTYHANNRMASERYFDIDGNPISLNEGQYGVRNEDNQIVYLDRDGNESFNIRRLLYNHSWIIIPCATIIIILSILANNELNTILCILYIIAIAYLTLMFREGGERQFLGLFEYYGKIFLSSEAREDIVKNIWLFIPLGTILYGIYPKRVILLVPIVLSIVIEGIQFIAGIGFCEIDDVISNNLGGCFGFYIGKLTKELLQRINIRSHKHSL